MVKRDMDMRELNIGFWGELLFLAVMILALAAFAVWIYVLPVALGVWTVYELVPLIEQMFGL